MLKKWSFQAGWWKEGMGWNDKSRTREVRRGQAMGCLQRSMDSVRDFAFICFNIFASYFCLYLCGWLDGWMVSGWDGFYQRGRLRNCCCYSCCWVWLFVTLWAVAHQAPLSMGLSQQEYWSGLPLHSPGDLPDPGIEPASPALAGGFSTEPPGKAAWGIQINSALGWRQSDKYLKTCL